MSAESHDAVDLVVEDEPATRSSARQPEDAGFAVRTVADAEAALGEIRRALPDLLLLDWMLPGQSGLALARGLRGEARTRELPIIMVTARGDEADRVAGLEAWVDDYVTKPFSPRSSSRLKDGMRRVRRSSEEALTVGSFRLDPGTLGDRQRPPVQLGPTEFRCSVPDWARPKRASRAHCRSGLGQHVYIEERTVDGTPPHGLALHLSPVRI